MNEDRSRIAATKDGEQQKTFFERISQALLREPKDREELTSLLRDAQQRNLLDPDALSMIEGVLEVADMQVRDVMVPRTQMAVVNQSDAPENFVSIIIDSAHSRFPVIGDSRDEVIGILLAKDLLTYFAQREQKSFNIRDYLRLAVFIPESKRLNVLLKEFRSSRNHMTIVIDEYNDVTGLVTIEDMLEQIVGDIEDEHDFEQDTYVIKHSDTRYTIKALTPIEDFNEMFNASFSTDEFDTIDELLINKFGKLPKRGEEKVLDQFKFKVLRADSRRIYLLQLSIVDVAQAVDANSAAGVLSS